MTRYESVKGMYAKFGVDTDFAIQKLKTYPYPFIVGKAMDVKEYENQVLKIR